MLVLTRKSDQEVVIDGKLVVTIVALEDGKVRIGFTANREVSVKRGEIYDMENGEGATEKLKKRLTIEQEKPC